MPNINVMRMLATVDMESVMNNPMSMSERLALSLQMIILGLATVFAVLIIIWFVLVLLRVFMYDMKKVKRIYVLGDGAEWIRSGARELSSQYCKAEFALDRYHLSKKINTITKEKAYRRLLTDYIVHGDRDSFLKTIDALYQNTEKTDKVTDSINYILKHMGAAVIMQNEVRIGCAMEQAISHVLASPFTCIPKAYVSSHLHTYVQARILYKNKQDLTRIYISACDNAKTANRSDSYNIDIDLTKEDLDFSIFDSKATDPYYHADLSTIDHRVQ